jgi:hypothetical protein
MHRLLGAIVGICLSGGSCLGTPARSPFEPPPAGGHHVLFIGNSLTDANDLPGTLASIATSVGDTIRTASVTAPDFALIDHLSGGTNAVATIQAGGWEFVVLQQGPSTLPLSRDSLILWTGMFDRYIRAAGARTALFMVWPDSTRRAFFDDCRVSYQMAAQSVNGLFLPAGAAWVAAWQAAPQLALYGPDGFHPSPIGTYLAALVMYERITGHDARALPAVAVSGGLTLGLSPDTVRLLQQTAHLTNALYP